MSTISTVLLHLRRSVFESVGEKSYCDVPVSKSLSNIGFFVVKKQLKLLEINEGRNQRFGF